MFKRGQQRLRDALKQPELPETYRKRSRETAANIIAAHHQRRAFTDVGNVPNVGQMPDLPLGTVVETPVRIDRNGFTPIAQKPLPPVVVGLLEPCARLFNMTLQACFDGNRDLALQALRLDPTCAHLDGDQVRDLGARLLTAHRRWIKCF
jgi:alpha-galactosidase